MPWRRRTDTLFRQVPDGVVVVSLEGGDPIWLASPGDEIWTLLASERTLDDLVERLAAQFGATPSTVRDDCIATLEALETQGVVEPCEGTELHEGVEPVDR